MQHQSPLNDRNRFAVQTFALGLMGLICMGATAATPGAVGAEVERAERAMNAAYEANDFFKYFAFLADDFQQFTVAGRTSLAAYRVGVLEMARSGARVQSVELHDLLVQPGPGADTAVASYDLHVKTREANGRLADERYRFSDVWFQRNHTWSLVHVHYSRTDHLK